MDVRTLRALAKERTVHVAEYLEIEQKFDVGAGFTLPDFGAVPGCAGVRGPVTYHLTATYFDTADYRLAASKITLRRRTGGTDEGWHLKLPAGTGVRREIRAPLAAGQGQVPDELATQVAGVTGGLPLVPIAVLRTERTVLSLLSSSSGVLAEIADDVVTARREATAGGPAPEPLRWREVEVEVPQPAPEVQEGAARLLLAAGAWPAGKASKLARLLES